MQAVALFLLLQGATATEGADDLLAGYDLRAILCPRDPDAIVICGWQEGARSEFQLPDRSGEWTPESDIYSIARERYGLLDPGRSGDSFYGSGGQALGPHPCSAVGPGGHSGCFMLRHRERELQYND